MNKIKIKIRASAAKILPSFLKKNIRIVYFKAKGSKSLKEFSSYKKNKDICVIGNGPSLKDDLVFLYSKIGLCDFVCVNQFSESKEYDILKPNVYLFLDEAWFSDDFPFLESIVYQTLDAINLKTTWKLLILVPFGSNLSIIKSRINNSNVIVEEFLSIPVSYEKKIDTILVNLDGCYAAPVSCNVINYSVYLSIIWGYSNIYICGLDMSIYRDILVSQLDNDKYLITKHFYEEDKKILLRKNPDRIEPWKMYELYHEASIIFKTHNILNEYAIKKGVNIINKSSFSMVDAYKRK